MNKESNTMAIIFFESECYEKDVCYLEPPEGFRDIWGAVPLSLFKEHDLKLIEAIVLGLSDYMELEDMASAFDRGYTTIHAYLTHAKKKMEGVTHGVREYERMARIPFMLFRWTGLTIREALIYGMMKKDLKIPGMSCSEIADALVLSISVVESALKKADHKMGIDYQDFIHDEGMEQLEQIRMGED